MSNEEKIQRLEAHAERLCKEHGVLAFDMKEYKKVCTQIRNLERIK